MSAEDDVVPLPPYGGSPYESRNQALVDQMPDQPGPEVLELIERSPQLLDAYVHAGLLAAIPVEHRVGEDPRYAKIHLLQWLRNKLLTEPERYPLGRGPLEQIWQDAVERRVSPRYALERAGDDVHVWSLSLAYVRALSRHAYLQMQDLQTMSDGWLLQEMALRSTEATLRPVSVEDREDVRQALESLFCTLWDEAVVEWLLAAALLVRWSGDGRVYRRAEDLTTRVVARARAIGDHDLLGRALHRMATISSDPYKDLPGLEDPETVRNTLRRRLEATLGQADHHTVDWAEADMPTPVVALSDARTRFREAADHRAGTNRALSLKGFFEATEALHLLGEDVDLAEAEELAREAVSLFDPEFDLRHILSLQSSLGTTATPGPVRPATRGRPWRNVRTEGLEHETNLAQADLRAQSDPLGALRALAQLHDEARELGPAARVALWDREVRLLPQVAATSSAPPGSRVPQSLQELGRNLEAATRLTREDRELDALALLAPPVPLPADLGALSETLDYHRMVLKVGAAVNVVASDPASSVDQYADALELALELGLESSAADLLRRLGWLPRDTPTSAVAKRLARRLLPLAGRLTGLGTTVQYELFRCCQQAFAAGATAGITEQDAFDLRAVIKGWTFAGSLQQGTRYRLDDDDEGQRQLAAIEDARAAEATSAPTTQTEPVLDDVLLTTCVSDRELRDGATAAERRQNMERVFDQRVFDPGSRTGDRRHTTTSPEGVRALLDAETALVDVLLGCDRGGRLVVYTWVHTRSATFVVASGRTELDGLVAWSPDGRLLRHPLADLVDQTREAVTQYPGPQRTVSRRAAELLDTVVEVVFGGRAGLADIADLAGLGVRRLVVVPHGPLHYLPFHLLPVGERTLADLFTVTVLPNLALLAPEVVPERVVPLRVLAMSFADGTPFGLPALEASVAEAAEIASAFHVVPEVDAEATEQSFRRALEEARRVHVSTHGELAPAGAFHRMYLWPDEESDGKLHAYELLDLDLHGLELLSMSACETALGRFDLLDNLRGLPAAFLLRGARHLVGTLWPAEVDAAKLFFTAMYGHLATTGSTAVAAFGHAQAVTRAARPQYRDWGPFYLVGGA